MPFERAYFEGGGGREGGTGGKGREGGGLN